MKAWRTEMDGSSTIVWARSRSAARYQRALDLADVCDARIGDLLGQITARRAPAFDQVPHRHNTMPAEDAEARVAAARAVADFNARAPVGTPVRFWTWTRDCQPDEGAVRHPATLNTAGRAVAWVTGHPACIALTHIEIAGGAASSGAEAA